jgi:hypothetical protein
VDVVFLAMAFTIVVSRRTINGTQRVRSVRSG